MSKPQKPPIDEIARAIQERADDQFRLEHKILDLIYLGGRNGRCRYCARHGKLTEGVCCLCAVTPETGTCTRCGQYSALFPMALEWWCSLCIDLAVLDWRGGAAL